MTQVYIVYSAKFQQKYDREEIENKTPWQRTINSYLYVVLNDNVNLRDYNAQIRWVLPSKQVWNKGQTGNYEYAMNNWVKHIQKWLRFLNTCWGTGFCKIWTLDKESSACCRRGLVTILREAFISMIRTPFSRTPDPKKLEMVLRYHVSEQTVNNTKPVIKSCETVTSTATLLSIHTKHCW